MILRIEKKTIEKIRSETTTKNAFEADVIYSFLSEIDLAPRILTIPDFRVVGGRNLNASGFLFLFLIVPLQLLKELGFGFHNCRSVASTTRAVPFALGFGIQLDARKVEPFDRAQVIVTSNHLAIGDLKIKSLIFSLSWNRINKLVT